MTTDAVDRSSLFSVDGLVVVITGGGTGIGRMIATALENNGATVYIVGRRLHVLESTAKESNKFEKMYPLQGDVTSKASLLSIVETLKAKHGYINLLVNNSGISFHDTKPPIIRPGSTKEDIKDLQSRFWNSGTPESWAKTFEVNCTAPYFCTVAFLELLDAGNRRGGAGGVTSQVIAVSSVAGFRRDSDNFSVSYSMSKAAVTHLGKLLANVLKDHKIRSNVIAPGFYHSEMTAEIASEDLVMKYIPLQRPGKIADMGGLALFLASRAGAYVNGTVHISDGGRLGLFSSTY
ncbi:NAD-binding protein [Neolentinus lepideus HHB14362 ss-1]|uniref:NAD-binding protein n=1 Tax=Neolentinus lepideus HHB14362 ss-1 TaxID=1314782 RepID=A0A165UVI6_9AGAM|nr:NAD-binding protein [Neolentinus lepideus HHB14362 ss-1]